MNLLNILLKIDWGHLSETPFVAEVWGSVSDWVMVAITLFTAIFLFKNFYEQLKINKATILKHKNELMPIFRIKHENDSFYLYVSNAPAFDILIFSTDTYSNRFPQDEPTEGFHSFWDITMHPVKIKYDEYRKLAKIENCDRQFSIWEIAFSDQEGRQYQQNIMGDRSGSYIDFPVLTKDI